MTAVTWQLHADTDLPSPRPTPTRGSRHPTFQLSGGARAPQRGDGALHAVRRWHHGPRAPKRGCCWLLQEKDDTYENRSTRDNYARP